MRKKRRKPYKTIAFKLSARQYKSLQNYCRYRHTTPIKLVKRSIAKYIECYSDAPSVESYVTNNQLELFDDI
ncbi:MAG: hypothetical protein PHU62_03960 [Bacteroidales bacterium]|jgi:hypothetical protein|nr:hypothetical protein [Bacteroidales bacterium]MDD2204757.1 hypothetical protein [Bacteroidales bacterium]MDD3151623.1 hypothetical protein [Bacteroidales bacterium]MDD3914180.1 hypothetical protein [Bacteroidales bacterium]MDD4633715.1 hypothetical protein [Bacteroidales bacterium]